MESPNSIQTAPTSRSSLCGASCCPSALLPFAVWAYRLEEITEWPFAILIFVLIFFLTFFIYLAGVLYIEPPPQLSRFEDDAARSLLHIGVGKLALGLGTASSLGTFVLSRIS